MEFWENSGPNQTQTEMGKFDLINFNNRKITGDYQVQVGLKYAEGDMGGGLVFNAPSNKTKQGAYMVSYTGKGGYMQWGYYDNSGVFQFQGGTPMANSGADGKVHTLAVQVKGTSYQVILDGTALGQPAPLLNVTAVGYTGLLTSTSRVLFENFKLENI